ncbi:MAG: phosphoribosylformylglycinamidine synthase subunit PurS [Endomicrobium sp.]|jgi:phosphoribosylformylglycinamidine synthase|nr:phosphoribosylformylglycinamidine synthase subunit PurS [Endomicrobium sp.]
MFRIEVFMKKCFKNPKGSQVLSDISWLGIKNIAKIEYCPLYLIDGDVKIEDVEKIASELLSDKVTEFCTVSRCSDLNSINVNSSVPSLSSSVSIIEIWYKKGVTDTVAESIVKAVKDLGITKDVKVKAGHKYCLYGTISRAILDTIVTKLLANTLVQEYEIK